MKNKKILFIFVLFLLLLFVFSKDTYCVYPTLVSRMNTAFEKIESWLLKLATPAAAVAVSTGLFMKKFSFGDEEKIRTGKNIIRSSLFSYAFILVLDLVLSAIRGLLS